MYFAELDVLYEMNNTDLQTRLKLFDGKHGVAKLRADSWYREAKVLNLKGDYSKVIQDLTENNFAIREGQNHLREANVDASLLLAKQKMAASKYQEALNILLNAHALPGQNVEKSECDDERMPQLDYYIGLVYKELKNKQKSGFYFNRSTNYKLKESDYVRYYQALSMINLGQNDKANDIFNYFIKYGQERLTKGQEVDYFAKYGERETLSQMKSSAHLLIGLGLKGLNKLEESKENLKKAVEFNASNIWAKAEL